MTMSSGSPISGACKSFSPKRSPKCYHKFLKPGALAKLRDSKIKAKHASRTFQTSLSELLLSPTSPSSPNQEEEQPLNEDNGIPCFDSSINLNRPRCLLRRKLFAVAPSFTYSDTYQF